MAPAPYHLAAFGDDGLGEPGGLGGVTLWAETGEERRMLLALAWQADPRLDEEAALQQRLAALA